MKAVILAGGLGTRLQPVTFEMPKALIPVQGKTLTEHVINKAKQAGCNEIYLSIGHMAGKVKDYFKDGKEFGVKIKYLTEEEPLGTGGWMHLIEGQNEDFFVLNGDNLFDLDMKHFMEKHKENKFLVTIALVQVEDVESRGVVALEGDKISLFVEKPKKENAPSNYVSSGYCIFSPQVFDYVPKEKKFMLEKELYPLLASKGLLGAYKSNAQWFDTGTFERWSEVIKKWRK